MHDVKTFRVKIETTQATIHKTLTERTKQRVIQKAKGMFPHATSITADLEQPGGLGALLNGFNKRR